VFVQIFFFSTFYYYIMFEKISGFGHVIAICELPSRFLCFIADYKGRSHDNVPVNSGGKPMNESSSNANKGATSTKVESKQSISDSRPKGRFPKPILIKLLNIYCQGQLELRDLLSCIVCSQ
jgi:hypothetical protein